MQKIKRNYSKITKPVAKWEPAKRLNHLEEF